jgi:hypothetical protein
MLMGVDALKANLGNIARPYLWRMLFSPPTSGNPQTLTIRCQTTQMPGRGFGTIQVPFLYTAGVVYPGKSVNPHQINIAFIEGEDRAVFKAAYAWLQAIQHDRLGVGLGDQLIKRDVELDLLTASLKTTNMRYRIMGCWTKEIPNVDLSMATDNTPVILPVVLSYDNWESF